MGELNERDRIIAQQSQMIEKVQQQLEQLMLASAASSSGHGVLSLVRQTESVTMSRASDSVGQPMRDEEATDSAANARQEKEQLLQEAAAKIIAEGQAVAQATAQVEQEKAALQQQQAQLHTHEVLVQSQMASVQAHVERQVSEAQCAITGREQLVEEEAMAERHRLRQSETCAENHLQAVARSLKEEQRSLAVSRQAEEAFHSTRWAAEQQLEEAKARLEAQSREAAAQTAAKATALQAQADRKEREWMDKQKQIQRREQELLERELALHDASVAAQQHSHQASSSAETDMLQKLLSWMDAYAIQMAEFKRELVDMRQSPQTHPPTLVQMMAGDSSKEDSGSGSNSESKFELSPSTLGEPLQHCGSPGGQGGQQGQLLLPKRRRGRSLTKLRGCQSGQPLLAMQPGSAM